VPLDESLCRVDLDISGRGGFFMHGEWPKEKAGTFDSYLAGEFLNSFGKNAEITLHLQIVCGDNAHHIVESAFKSVAAALRKAIARDASIDGVPSTKGVL
ncbi:MAG: imidazoleglycerol-phosphate dehydratase, partial [Candidatus Lindowbacteria bacterium]|nr:imidazoleglycerol-phosphate dehydratase [Candidatus Lindowbacteria bacterium]